MTIRRNAQPTCMARQTATSRLPWAHGRGTCGTSWYSLVVDCHDPRKQARWWAEALGWTLIHDSETECIIIPSWVNEAVVRETPWERWGPGMVFVPVPEGRFRESRTDRRDRIAAALLLGATMAR